MNVLIVDDEKRARQTLIGMAKLCCPDIHSYTEASDVASAITKIKTQKPDLVFLDIDLGQGSGFDIIEALKEMELNVVFVTAHNEYALRALKASAIDYLLKPIKTTDLIAAVKKTQKKLAKVQDSSNEIKALLLNLQNQDKELEKIVIKTSDSIHVINIKEIIYCEADKGYTTFHLLDNKVVLSSRTLREYENLLPVAHFMRIHQSFLVNLNYISRYDKKDKNYIVTTSNHKLPVSTRKKEVLMAYFDRLSF